MTFGSSTELCESSSAKRVGQTVKGIRQSTSRKRRLIEAQTQNASRGRQLPLSQPLPNALSRIPRQRLANCQRPVQAPANLIKDRMERLPACLVWTEQVAEGHRSSRPYISQETLTVIGVPHQQDQRLYPSKPSFCMLPHPVKWPSESVWPRFVRVEKSATVVANWGTRTTVASAMGWPSASAAVYGVKWRLPG